VFDIIDARCNYEDNRKYDRIMLKLRINITMVLLKWKPMPCNIASVGCSR